jgi:hypothetical protein
MGRLLVWMTSSPSDWSVSSNGTENWNKIVIRRDYSGATRPESGCFFPISTRTRRISRLIHCELTPCESF